MRKNKEDEDGDDEKEDDYHKSFANFCVKFFNKLATSV